MNRYGKGIAVFLALILLLGLLSGAYASGEPSGEASGAASGGSSGGASADASEDGVPILLDPVELPELILGPGESYEFTADTHVGRLEIDPAASVSCDYPIVVTFDRSATVANGRIEGFVQFVSDYDEIIAVVHTNDVHGHIGVEPYVKGFADALKASGYYSLVLTVSAGDIYGGGEAVAGSYNGEFIPAIMDPVYDVIAPGNNDFGSPGVVRQNLLLSALYDHTRTICANVETKAEGLPLASYAASYEPVVGEETFDALYDKVTAAPWGGLDMSALGMTDLPGKAAAYPHTTTFTTSRGTVVGLFGLSTSGGALDQELDGRGSLMSAQESVDDLRAAGADVVVGVGHTGWMGRGATGASSNDTNSWQLANQVTGLDAFVDGHTHSVINWGQGVLVGTDPTYVNQAECFGDCIGVMYIFVKDGEVLAVQGDVIQDMSSIVPDPQVQALVDLATARVKEDFGKPIAETPYFLNGERLSSANEGGTVRGNETNLGDLMTDVIRAAASEKMGVDYDFCAYPGFWLRSSVEAGDITLESIQGSFANPTVLYYDTYTGEQVVSMVTRALNSVYPQKEDTTFNQYSGITVTFVNNNGTGTPLTIRVGDTEVYDAARGGLLVDGSWTCTGVLTMTGGEIDSYTGDMANWICHDKTEVQALVGDWFQSHGPADYTVYPNTIAPAGRIVEVQG